MSDIKFLPGLTVAIDSVTVDNLPATLGQKTAANSLSIVIASDGALPLPTGAATEAAQDTGNTALAAIQTATEATQAAVEGTLAISAAALPLPTGAATEAKQDSAITLLTTIETNTFNAAANTVDTTNAVSLMNAKVVTQSLNFGAVSGGLRTAAQIGNSAGPAAFDTGAATAQTLRTVLATRHEAAATPVATRITDGTDFISSTAIAASQVTASSFTKVLPTLAIMAGWDGSQHYELKVDDVGSMVTNPKGKYLVEFARHDYSSSPVTTGAWTEIVANISDAITRLHIFDSSGQTMELGAGGAGGETRILLIPPGGIEIDLEVGDNNRYAIRAVSGNATAGELVINFLL